MKVTLPFGYDTSAVYIAFRYHETYREQGEIRSQKSTTAILELIDIEGNKNFIEATAWLKPGEQSCKRIGRKEALRKALSLAGLAKQERREIWEGLVTSGMRLAQ